MGHQYHDNSYDPMPHSFIFSILDDIYQFTGHTTGISTALSFQIGRILELPNILLTFITSYPLLCVNKSTPYRLSVDLYQISCISLVKKTKLSPPERFLMAAKNKQVLSPYILMHITYLFLDSILLLTETDFLIDALSTESLLSAECPELGQLSHLVSLSWSSEKLLKFSFLFICEL